jgi:hypothetical protein
VKIVFLGKKRLLGRALKQRVELIKMPFAYTHNRACIAAGKPSEQGFQGMTPISSVW